MKAPAIDTTVLLVDDEQMVADVFTKALEAAGFTVAVAHRGTEALEVFDELAPDAIVLDVVLPDTSGITVCETLRKRSSVPIVMISGRAKETEVIAALEAGADDYLVKPFSIAVLVARVRAALRRASPPDAPDALLSVGPLTLSPARHQAWLRGQALDLPDREFALLEALVRHPGRVITRASLTRDVWGSDGSVTKKALDATVRRLRQKLGEAGRDIVTVRGVGFLFERPK